MAEDNGFSRRATPQTIIAQLEQLAKDKRVKAIVLRVNSPGGTVGASQEIYQAITKIKKDKKLPIVTSFADIGASGAYWVALSSDTIIANPGSLIGSIGVIMSSFDLTGLGDKIGVGQNTIKSGQFKDIMSSWRDMKNDEKQLLQAVVDDVHDQFIDVFSTSRKLSKKQARSLADGRIFTGRQAQKEGLIDALGSYQDALNLAQKMAGLPGEPHVIDKAKPSIQDMFEMIKVNTLSPISNSVFQHARFGDIKVH